MKPNNPVTPEQRAMIADWLNAFKADPFHTGADKVDSLLTRLAMVEQGPDVEAMERKLYAEMVSLAMEFDTAVTPPPAFEDMSADERQFVERLARAALGDG